MLAAIALLLLNDHVLKAAWPGPVTGKLSDAAGLAFFPILIVSAWELGRSLAGRPRRPSMRALLVAVVLTALGITLVKTMPSVAAAYGGSLGVAQWLLALPGHAVVDHAVPPVVATRVVVDPSDLVALPGLVLALWVGMGRVGRSTASGMPRPAMRASE